jgi:hypothetical protein
MSQIASSGEPPSLFSLEINLSTLTNGLTNVASFVNRAGAIVNNPSDYYVSVTRLIVNTQRIPLWQPVLNTTPPYNNVPYNTIYSVNLRYKTFTSGQFYMRIINDDNTITPPATPITSQPTNGWGNVYSYDVITQMISEAIQRAYTQLLINVGDTATLDPNPPYMTWNAITQLFTMNCYPMSQYDQVSGGDYVEIFFNTEFKPFLLGWLLHTYTNATNTPDGLDCSLILLNNGINYTPQNNPPSFIPNDPATTLLQMSQDISAPFCYVALNKILVITSLPLAYPCLTDLPLDLTNTAFNNQSSPILIDYLVNYSQGGASSFQQPISYSAVSDIYSSPVKLGGTQPISSFNVQIFYQTLNGNTYPLQTIGLRNSSIKLTFVHKSIIEKKYR